MRSEEIVDGIVKNVKAGSLMDRSTVFFKKDKKGKVIITARKEEAFVGKNNYKSNMLIVENF